MLKCGATTLNEVVDARRSGADENRRAERRGVCPHEVDSSTSGVDVAQRSGHAEKTQEREIYRLVRVQGLEAAMGPVAFGLGSQLEGTGEAAG